ncbi:MAG: hypothetical protein C0621_08685 [Desulfuromonas sp.]|nr:MAG: hypothetical protein C0621_08685 [Desulfuromonas sp.]
MSESSPWICHVCDQRFYNGEGEACERCYKTTCPSHLKKGMVRNPESGLYEPQNICAICAAGLG